jgi:hypothetical protein
MFRICDRGKVEAILGAFKGNPESIRSCKTARRQWKDIKYGLGEDGTISSRDTVDCLPKMSGQR